MVGQARFYVSLAYAWPCRDGIWEHRFRSENADWHFSETKLAAGGEWLAR